MTLIKWAPRPASIFDDMDKMINNVFENDWNFPVRSKTNWSPAVDVKESDNSFTLIGFKTGRPAFSASSFE